jgi:type IV pilus assembly protein PilO
VFAQFSKITLPVYQFIEKRTRVQRIAICAASYLLLCGGFGGLSLYPKFSEMTRLQEEVRDLEEKLTVATNKARQLTKFRKMLENAEADLNFAKRALPERKEIPSLLTGISTAGKEAGLEFFLFEPRGETQKDFYAEIPVSIRVRGPYHSVALFFDKVSRLFRVVNISDVQMNARANTQDLDTACTAVTYRFLEKGAQEKEPEKKGKSK